MHPRSPEPEDYSLYWSSIGGGPRTELLDKLYLCAVFLLKELLFNRPLPAWIVWIFWPELIIFVPWPKCNEIAYTCATGWYQATFPLLQCGLGTRLDWTGMGWTRFFKFVFAYWVMWLQKITFGYGTSLVVHMRAEELVMRDITAGVTSRVDWQ